MSFPEEGQQRVRFDVALMIALAVGAVCFGAGVLTATKTTHANGVLFVNEQMPEGVDLSPVWRAWRVIDEKFVPASVSTTSIEAASTTDPYEKRVWGLIQGLAGSLDDPYTFFLPPAEQKQFTDDMTGAFEGVGMEIAVRDQVLTIVAPLRNTPAERAGLRAGDIIMKIGDKETKGMDVSTAVQNIRGPKGSSVTLLVLREGWTEPQTFDVVREVINIPIVNSELRPDGVFVIEIASFTANSPGLFRDALRQFVESGSSRLLIDLRGNPGGYLDAAVEMASWFLPAGKIVVVEDYAGHESNITHRSRGYDIFSSNLHMVILVDRGSASASEILALALRSHGKAKLVGTNTFGKGSVQELIEITPETALKLTVARWLGPNGETIPHSGIEPDVAVDLVEEKKGETVKDEQLEKAIEMLRAQ